MKETLMAEATSTNKDKPAKAAASKPTKKSGTRKVLSPSERVAKAEQELRELREKADKANRKQADELTEKREKLVAKRDELSTKIQEIDGQLERLEVQPDPKSPVTRANDQANAGSEDPAPAVVDG